MATFIKIIGENHGNLSFLTKNKRSPNFIPFILRELVYLYCLVPSYDIFQTISLQQISDFGLLDFLIIIMELICMNIHMIGLKTCTEPGTKL